MAVRMQRKQQLMAGAAPPDATGSPEEDLPASSTAEEAAFQDDDDRVLRLKALEQLEGMMQPNMCGVGKEKDLNEQGKEHVVGS